MSNIKVFGSHLVDFSIIPDNGIFIDAGACVGKFIKEIQKHIKDPYIFAIEPNKKNVESLKGEGYDQVMILEAALVGSEEPKIMKFNEFAGLPEWGNVTGLYENRNHITYDVETMDLKELLALVPLSVTIHHFKMDIEGSEHKVVQDMTKETAKRIQQISMEVHGGVYDTQQKLISLGYKTQFINGELYAIQQEL